MENELLPCPFCGSIDIEIKLKFEDLPYFGWMLTHLCFKESAYLGNICFIKIEKPTEDGCVKSWNARTVTPKSYREVYQGGYERGCKDVGTKLKQEDAPPEFNKIFQDEMLNLLA